MGLGFRVYGFRLVGNLGFRIQGLVHFSLDGRSTLRAK